MKDVSKKFKLLWIQLKRNANAIIAICAIGALIISLYALFQGDHKEEKTYTSKRPNIKIKSVYLKTIPYRASDGSQSIALKFFIPIKNEGDITAYKVEIKKKELDLVRGDYNLDTPSLQTRHTSAPFNLKPGQMVEDTIFIDESPAYMQNVSNGEKTISLKYEICFYADSKSKSDPFVYKYEISFTKGQFQSDSVRESVHQEIKP